MNVLFQSFIVREECAGCTHLPITSSKPIDSIVYESWFGGSMCESSSYLFRLNFYSLYVTLGRMKKTNTKLQLKKSTVRVLRGAALKAVVGGAFTQDLEYCSSSCNVCPSQHTDCCDSNAQTGCCPSASCACPV